MLAAGQIAPAASRWPRHGREPGRLPVSLHRVSAAAGLQLLPLARTMPWQNGVPFPCRGGRTPHTTGSVRRRADPAGTCNPILRINLRGPLRTGTQQRPVLLRRSPELCPAAWGVAANPASSVVPPGQSAPPHDASLWGCPQAGRSGQSQHTPGVAARGQSRLAAAVNGLPLPDGPLRQRRRTAWTGSRPVRARLTQALAEGRGALGPALSGAQSPQGWAAVWFRGCSAVPPRDNRRWWRCRRCRHCDSPWPAGC